MTARPKRRPTQCRSAKKPVSRPSPPSPTAPAEPAVHRHIHPIHAAPVSRPPSGQELLTYILETLNRQNEALNELLRRTGGDSPETK